MSAARNELRSLSAEIDTLFDLGKKEEGAALLRRALAESADDKAYRLFFSAEAAGYLERDAGKQRKLLREACRLEESDPFLTRNLGVFFLMNGSERKAIRLFDRAIELDPSDSDAFRCKGLAWSNLGRESKGMEWFARAVSINPSDYDAMRQTGVSLSKLGKDLEAIGWYRQALAVNGDDYDSMRQMAVSLAMLGKYEAAVEWLNLALAVNPNDLESRRNLNLVKRKISGEGETIFTRIFNYLGRKLAFAWRRLLNLL